MISETINLKYINMVKIDMIYRTNIKLMFLLLFLLQLTAFADETPEVVMVAGNAYIQDNKNIWHKLRVSQHIEKKSVIKVDANSQLSISLNNSRVNLSGPVIFRIEDIIFRTESKESSKSSSLNTIIKRITGSMKSQEQTTVLSVRGEKMTSDGSPEWADSEETLTPCLDSCSRMISERKFREAENCLGKKKPQSCQGTYHYFHGLIRMEQGQFSPAAVDFKKARSYADLKGNAWEHSLVLEALTTHYCGSTADAAAILEKDLGQISAYRKDALALLELFFNTLGNSSRSAYYGELIRKESPR
jgi:hypothetical protein